MVRREFWTENLHSALKRRSIVWLSGVRRVGKTSLVKQLGRTLYLNCDRPSVQRELSDPEFFLANVDRGFPLVLDEVHRLNDPTTLLKIAADEYPDLRIIATGSSTLGATRVFRDTLTGRKISIRLSPVLWRERAAFEEPRFDHRILHGGMPELLLGSTDRTEFFDEWIQSYYARDIEELFSIRNRSGYLTLMQLLMRRSAGQLDVTDLSKESGVSRPTVVSWLDSMEVSNLIYRLKPYHGGSVREIVRRPKIYGFDTGLIAWVSGIDDIRESDRGLLWEHLVLDELRSMLPDRQLSYWRDKSGREIDFIVQRERSIVDTIEAKINANRIDVSNVTAFRGLYPQGRNYIVVPYPERPRKLRIDDYTFTVCEPSAVPVE